MTTSSPARRARVRKIRGKEVAPVEAAALSARAVLERELAALHALREAHAPLAELKAAHARTKRAVTLAYNGAAAAASTLSGSYLAWRAWRSEATRLSTLRQQLMMRERDDLGVLPANAVRIGTRAAIRPLQAGTHTEATSYIRATVGLPRIGVDLPATLATAQATDAARAGARAAQARPAAIAAAS
ncbi:MAG TPA: hypothetical protein VLC50_01410 [Actinomycetes bacterium]|nr:hypothetical protein [Actinomycetes bacterium]